MRKITRTALATFVAVPLLAAACGDDDDVGSAADTPTQNEEQAPSGDEYVAAGTAICEEAGPRIVEAFPDPDGEPDVAYLRSIAGPIADVMEDTREKFAELDPPADATEGHETLLDEIDRAVDELREVLEDDDAADAMLEEGPPLDGPAQAAAALGFENCGGG